MTSIPAEGRVRTEDGTTTAVAGSAPLRASAAAGAFVLALLAFLPFVAGDAGLFVFDGLDLGFHPGILFFTGVGGALLGTLTIAQVRSLGARDPLDDATIGVALFAVAVGALDFLLYLLLAVAE